MSPDFVYDGTLLGGAEMLRGGVTCCNDMYFYPDAAARAYENAGMRALIGMPILDFPTPYAADADAYLPRGLAARDAFKHVAARSPSRSRRTRRTRSATRRGRRVVMYARQLDLPIQTHLAETRARSRRSARDDRRVRRSPASTGWARPGPGFIAIHAVHVDAADIAMLAAQGCHVVHCPASNMKLASGIAPVARAAGGRHQRRARHRRRRVEQPARHPFGDAPREPAREGRDRRRRRGARGDRAARWPR